MNIMNNGRRAQCFGPTGAKLVSVMSSINPVSFSCISLDASDYPRLENVPFVSQACEASGGFCFNPGLEHPAVHTYSRGQKF